MLGHNNSLVTYHGLVPSWTSASKDLRMSSRKTYDRHIFVVYGPAGCGKTSIAKYIAEKFNLKYIEGDEVSNNCEGQKTIPNIQMTLSQYHPPANIAKMTAEIPLDDADRWDWLISLREAAVQALVGNVERGVVIACSALKQKYRDVIRVANIEYCISTRFICLQADRDTLSSRICRRNDHFMPLRLVDSQLRDLEPIGKSEADIVTIDVRGSLEENEVLAATAVRLLLSSR
jgi:gluconokinase